MSALRAHEHLSPFVQQCVATFHTLSCKITESQHLGTRGGQSLAGEGGAANMNFQDIFQDMGFDSDNLLFGREDMSWLGNFDPNQ